MNHYDKNRDPEALEPHYSRHAQAMTVEQLHDKGDIAQELAWRDQRIEQLEAQLEAVGAGGITQGWPLMAADRKRRDDLEAQLEKAVTERDDYHDMADQLAEQIAAITDQEIGEHSSGNNPWQNAMLAADEWIARDIRRLTDGVDRKRRGEPVAWTTPDEREPISAPLKESRLDLYSKHYTVPLYTAPQPAEPVNVPSDAEIDDLWDLHEDSRTFARALLAERDGLLEQHGRDSATLREYAQQRDDLRKERDALREACGKAVEYLEGWASADPYVDILRAALAQHQGEKSDDQ